MSEVTVAANIRCIVGEGPVWHDGEAALYWVDIKNPTVHRLHPATGSLASWPMPERIGFLMPRAGGGFVAGLKSGLKTVDLAAGAIEPICDPEPHFPDNRFNDGKVDRQGRLWAGTMDDAEGASSSGSLYRLHGDGRWHVMESGVHLSNGLGWSPDDRTLYFTDSLRQTIYAYDYDAATGDIANRRVFARIGQAGVFPDGLAVDVDGFVWTALFGGGRVERFDPDGRIERTRLMPVPQPTCCAFGGADLGTLYVTSASAGLDDAALARAPLSGALFALEPGVRGQRQTPFAG